MTDASKTESKAATPRTDALFDSFGPMWMPLGSELSLMLLHARQLERELTDMSRSVMRKAEQAADWQSRAEQLTRDLSETAIALIDAKRRAEKAETALAELIERCAKVCDKQAEANEVRGNVISTFPEQQYVAELHIQGAMIARDCAAAIRALKD